MRAFALVLLVAVSGCTKSCDPGSSQFGCNVAACPAGQTAVCNGQCAAILADGSPCLPAIDCTNPAICGAGARCVRPGADEFRCTTATTWGNGCDPSLGNQCAQGLFCMDQRDFQVNWQATVPPGFCAFDRQLGASCVGAVSGRQQECGEGLFCAADHTCRRTCDTDANCPCNAGLTCANGSSISPPGPQGNGCYACADKATASPPCSATSPCCNPGSDCAGVAHLGGSYCCHERGNGCGTGQECCGTDICRSGACAACTPKGSACTADGDCCFGNGAKCCGNACTTTATDPKNCGTCGKVCPALANAKAPTCVNGACPLVCLDGFANCDNNAANGCEINLNVDPKHCGACGQPCPAGDTCMNGRCMPPPPPPDAGTGNCSSVMQACVPDNLPGAHCCNSKTQELCVFELCRPCTQHGQVCPQSGSQICCSAAQGDECVFDQFSDTIQCNIPDNPPGQ
jgi:hypothetical protein